jgi:hypothetical protein
MTLSDRISRALEQPGVAATEIASLISEIEADLVLTRAAGAEARTKARDPLTAEQEVTAARMQETDAAFREERLTVAVERLKQKHELAVTCEREQARKAEIAATEAERDQLVEELKEKYPRLAGELAALLGRIEANNERCRKHHLTLVEYRARGLGPSDVHFLTAAVRLPALEGRAHAMGERFWPPAPERIGNVLPDSIVEAMARAGEESRRTTEAGRALRAANEGRSTKRLPA